MAVFGDLTDKNIELSVEDIMMVSCEATNDVLLEIISPSITLGLENTDEQVDDGLFKKFKEFLKKIKNIISSFFKKVKIKINQLTGKNAETIKKDESKYRKMTVPKNFACRNGYMVDTSYSLNNLITNISSFINANVNSMLSRIPIDEINEKSLMSYFTNKKSDSVKDFNDIVRRERLGERTTFLIKQNDLNAIINSVVTGGIPKYDKIIIDNIFKTMNEILKNSEHRVMIYTGQEKRTEIVAYVTQVINLSLNIFTSIIDNLIKINEVVVEQNVGILHKLKRAQ